ncbi:MAG: 50S ribosomal protein L23 [Fimbriimonadaceae bacterium]
MKDPHSIIIKPHITERTVALSYGDPRIREEALVTRKYTFYVAPGATKIEIKNAFEAIFNAGKKKDDDKVEVAKVNVTTVRGKLRRVSWQSKGYRPSRRKAIITLKPGQMIEEYGV